MASNSDVLHPIQEVPLLYKRTYKRELDFFDMIELLPSILRKTGSIATATYLFRGTTEDFCLDLPCNVYSIQSVSDQVPMERYYGYLLPAQSVLVNNNLASFQEQEESNDDTTAIIYEFNRNVVTKPLGRLIPFNIQGKNESIHINYDNLPVDIIYVGTVVDEEGYPKVPYKTIEAIVAYMNHLEIKSMYFMKQADYNMKKEAEAEMNTAIAQARTPDWMNQNQTDDLLRVFTNSNKKQFNRSLRG